MICVYVAESHGALNRQSFIRNNRRTVNFHAACFKTTVGSYGNNSVFAGNNRSFAENTPGRFTSLHGFSGSGRSYRNSSVFRLVISDEVYLIDRTEIQRQFRAVSGNGKLRVGVCDCELHRSLLHIIVRDVEFYGIITRNSKPGRQAADRGELVFPAAAGNRSQIVQVYSAAACSVYVLAELKFFKSVIRGERRGDKLQRVSIGRKLV